MMGKTPLGAQLAVDPARLALKAPEQRPEHGPLRCRSQNEIGDLHCCGEPGLGNGAAFHVLVGCPAAAPVRLAVSLVGNSSDAEDVCRSIHAPFALAGSKRDSSVKTRLTRILVYPGGNGGATKPGARWVASREHQPPCDAAATVQHASIA